jgi:hypothetical protein
VLGEGGADAGDAELMTQLEHGPGRSNNYSPRRCRSLPAAPLRN